LDWVEQRTQWCIFRYTYPNKIGAYAADGYARIHGAAAFVTTYGVGELSAINAIAGAFAEQGSHSHVKFKLIQVPIIHIVGAPSTSQQNSRQILHHTLGIPVFDIFQKTYEPYSAASVAIDAFTTGAHIDRTIETCLHRNLPIYILFPQDLVSRKISSEPLSRPLEIRLNANDPDETACVLGEILKVLEEAERPVILADAGASRDNVISEVEELCRTCSDWPVYVSAMGKGSVNEQLPNYAGTYVGGLSHPCVTEFMEKADCVLSIGRFTSDFNTGFFTSKFPCAKVLTPILHVSDSR
jgi:pyruvate decarboxylase